MFKYRKRFSAAAADATTTTTTTTNNTTTTTTTTNTTAFVLFSNNFLQLLQVRPGENLGTCIEQTFYHQQKNVTVPSLRTPPSIYEKRTSERFSGLASPAKIFRHQSFRWIKWEAVPLDSGCYTGMRVCSDTKWVL